MIKADGYDNIAKILRRSFYMQRAGSVNYLFTNDKNHSWYKGFYIILIKNYHLSHMFV